VGVFLLIKDKFSLLSRVVFGISLVFSLWAFNIIAQWLTPASHLNYFFWQMSPLLEVFIPILLTYFVYLFLWKKDVEIIPKILVFLLLLPVFILLPTINNMGAFDPGICEPTVGPLTLYIYGIEILSIFLIAFLGIKKYKEKKTETSPGQILLVSLSSLIFLSIFSIGQIFGEITKIYEVDLIGPIGMVLFLVSLAYMIVKFHAFNTRIIGTQMLVIALGVLVFAMLFVRKIENVRYVIIVTLGVVAAVGGALIKSVKKEVALREETQKLAKNLEFVNIRQLETMRFITHEVKGYLTDASAGFDAITSGSFGPVAPDIKDMSQEALARVQYGVNEVKNFLHVSDFKTGKVTYAMEKINLTELLVKSAEDLKKRASDKKLTLTVNVPEGDSCTILGDADYIVNHILKNLIDNAINYTPEGSVAVSLSHTDGKVLFSVKDSGVGLSDEDKAVLFTEGGRGKDSRVTNVHSTGYGLFIAKQIVTAHNGRIWAESQGRGTGSTFFVEFPAV
jgi:signal transduction histidine kinase